MSGSIRELVKEAIDATEGVDAMLRPALAAEVLRWLLARDRAQAVSTTGTAEPTSPSAPAGTLGESLAKLGRKTHPELLAAIAAYRFQADGRENLTVEDFVESYREVRQSRPQNFSDAIATAIRKGWLVPGPIRDGSKTWRVGSTGLSTVTGWYRATESI